MEHHYAFMCPKCGHYTLYVVYEDDGIITLSCNSCDYYEVNELEKPHGR